MQIGFGGLLTIVFITLKLLNIITWRLWVLSPLWIGLVIMIVFGAIAVSLGAYR